MEKLYVKDYSSLIFKHMQIFLDNLFLDVSLRVLYNKIEFKVGLDFFPREATLQFSVSS